MASHTISVTVEPGSIRVSPDTLTMTSEDDVQWAGTNSRKFSIDFGAASPFAERQFDHAGATRKQHPNVNGRYKYSIVSAEDPGVVLDPVIIVEDPPTKPQP